MCTVLGDGKSMALRDMPPSPGFFGNDEASLVSSPEQRTTTPHGRYTKLRLGIMEWNELYSHIICIQECFDLLRRNVYAHWIQETNT